jgi:hypothetical protein
MQEEFVLKENAGTPAPDPTGAECQGCPARDFLIKEVCEMKSDFKNFQEESAMKQNELECEVGVLRRKVEAQGGTSVSSSLVPPPGRENVFEDCWFDLFSAIRHSGEVDAFIRDLQKCKKKREIIQVYVDWSKNFPRIQKKRELRSPEFLRNLCSLVNNLEKDIEDYKILSRCLSDNFKKHFPRRPPHAYDGA